MSNFDAMESASRLIADQLQQDVSLRLLEEAGGRVNSQSLSFRFPVEASTLVANQALAGGAYCEMLSQVRPSAAMANMIQDLSLNHGVDSIVNVSPNRYTLRLENEKTGKLYDAVQVARVGENNSFLRDLRDGSMMLRAGNTEVVMNRGSATIRTENGQPIAIRGGQFEIRSGTDSFTVNVDSGKIVHYRDGADPQVISNPSYFARQRNATLNERH